VVARHLSRPLERIQAVVRRVAAGELSSRVGGDLVARRDEYGRLAEDFDRMAARIEGLVNSRDQLLHDVSHELRAPLSRLRFALELAREDRSEELLERADREIARIDALVGELLALARLDHATDRALPQVEVDALMQDVLDAEQPQAEHAGVKLAAVLEPLKSPGDSEGLRRAFENVLRNALRHAPSGGAVDVALSRERDEVVLRIADRGPGVAPEELGRLFEPFFRGQAASGREGHGLGLAIVARVMRAHRGRAEARNREGGGLEVALRWPLAPATEASGRRS
jgi:signal transduction histidine kinase